MPPTFFVMESGSADALVSLAGRMLAYAALDRSSSVLFRLAGTIWTHAPDRWPPPSAPIAAWLRQQEFASPAAYWTMTVATTRPRLYVCGSATGEGELPPGMLEHSLTRFLADASESGCQPVWI